MPAARLFTHTGEAKGEIQLPAATFGAEPNRHVLWEAVRSHLANQRQGTSQVKGRSDVSGGGRKPWRQKGTGRARSGSNRSPVWVGGGRVFGPHPREYRLGLPRGIKRVALRSALSTKVGEGEVRVVADFHIAEPRTRVVAEILKKLELEGRKCLWVLAEHDAEFVRAARNIPALSTREYRLLNAYDVLHADCLIIMESAVSKIEEAWGS